MSLLVLGLSVVLLLGILVTTSIVCIKILIVIPIHYTILCVASIVIYRIIAGHRSQYAKGFYSCAAAPVVEDSAEQTKQSTREQESHTRIRTDEHQAKGGIASENQEHISENQSPKGGFAFESVQAVNKLRPIGDSATESEDEGYESVNMSKAEKGASDPRQPASNQRLEALPRHPAIKTSSGGRRRAVSMTYPQRERAGRDGRKSVTFSFDASDDESSYASSTKTLPDRKSFEPETTKQKRSLLPRRRRTDAMRGIRGAFDWNNGLGDRQSWAGPAFR